MANTALGGIAVCPFYMSDDGHGKSITCEGIYGRSISHNFKNKAGKMAHAEKYCTTKNCENCEIYKVIMKKYEVINNG